jgi:hypothetical protein
MLHTSVRQEYSWISGGMHIRPVSSLRSESRKSPPRQPEVPVRNGQLNGSYYRSGTSAGSPLRNLFDRSGCSVMGVSTYSPVGEFNAQPSPLIKVPNPPLLGAHPNRSQFVEEAYGRFIQSSPRPSQGRGLRFSHEALQLLAFEREAREELWKSFLKIRDKMVTEWDSSRPQQPQSLVAAGTGRSAMPSAPVRVDSSPRPLSSLPALAMLHGSNSSLTVRSLSARTTSRASSSSRGFPTILGVR